MLHKCLLCLPSFLEPASHHWQSYVHLSLPLHTDTDHRTDVLRQPSFRYLLRLLLLLQLLQPDMPPEYLLLKPHAMQLSAMYLIQSHVSYIRSHLQYNSPDKMQFLIAVCVRMHPQNQYCCQVHIHMYHLLYGFLLIPQLRWMSFPVITA